MFSSLPPIVPLNAPVFWEKKGKKKVRKKKEEEIDGLNETR